MLTNKEINGLYRKVLREPLDRGCDQLAIVSGYGSAAMVKRHLKETESAGLSVKLVLGMTRKDGLPRRDHDTFRDLNDDNRFNCYYIADLPDIHAKVYVWLNAGKPCLAYVGSANYSHNGFSLAQIEAMDVTDPDEAYEFYTQAVNRSVSCADTDIENAITIFAYDHGKYPNNEKLTIPLYGTDGSGEMHPRSGLNWGFGRGRARDTNEAYIPLYKDNVHSDFFPGRLEPDAKFTIETDDGVIIHQASRGQGANRGKGISTPDRKSGGNRILGEYFRRRMGVPKERRFCVADFEAYGRHDVTFTKIDDDTYYMDFSVS